MKYVTDTSIILAIVMGESKRAGILTATKGATITAPASLPWEVGNAFSAMLKRKRIQLAEAQQGVLVFQQIPIQYIDIDFANALTLSAEFNIYAYDAYFLDCCLRNASPLLTLDSRQRDVAQELGIKIIEV